MKSLHHLLLVCVIASGANLACAQSFIFSTIAGTVGAIGSVDETNSAARFNFPAGLAVDGGGNLFVSDLLNHTVRKISPVGTNWVVTTLAGQAGFIGSVDGTNSAARFDHPTGIAVDAAGNVFVADKYNDTIRKLTAVGTDWVVTTIVGSPGLQSDEDGTNSNAHFWGPSGVAIDETGDLFVVDSSNFTIRGIVPEGTNWIVSTLAGTPLAYGFEDGFNGLAQFNYPYSVARNSVGALYVTDWGNHAIREITQSGSDWYTETISGFSGLAGTNDGSGLAPKFNYPTGIAVDAQNNVYVTDYGSHTIRRLSSATGHWVVSTIGGAPLLTGSADGLGSAARFWRPWGIAVDRQGNLFIADYRNQTIRKGTPNVPPLPQLQIANSKGSIIIWWPLTATNYQLQTTASLALGATWSQVTSNIAVQGNNYVFTNQPLGAAAFYRLRLNSGFAEP